MKPPDLIDTWVDTARTLEGIITHPASYSMRSTWMTRASSFEGRPYFVLSVALSSPSRARVWKQAGRSPRKCNQFFGLFRCLCSELCTHPFSYWEAPATLGRPLGTGCVAGTPRLLPVLMVSVRPQVWTECRSINIRSCHPSRHQILIPVSPTWTFLAST